MRLPLREDAARHKKPPFRGQLLRQAVVFHLNA